jgi:hypothetical protein
MKKRGGAQEFIMTYGWAILVFAAVISALAYFDVFNGKNAAPDICMVGLGFACKDAKATADTLQLTIQNGAIRELSAFSIGFEGSAYDCAGSQSLNPSDPGIPGNGTKTDKWWYNATAVSILETRNIADFTFTGCTNSLRATTDFIISYTISGETVTHEVSGQANLKVED